MFLEQQISILEGFLKDLVILKTESSAAITGVKYILKIYKKITVVKIFQNIIDFTVIFDC